MHKYFISFYCQEIFHCVDIHIFYPLFLFNYLAHDGHLGCFHCLVIMNNTAMKKLHVNMTMCFQFSPVRAKSLLLLCDPTDCSPPGPSVHGISQAVILEWVTSCFCRGSSWPRDWNQVSCIGREPSEPPGKRMESQNFRSKYRQAE